MNLSWEVRFFCEEWAGIEVLAKPIFVRGVSPFNGWRTLRPLHPKSLCQIGSLGFSERTLEVYTNLSWEVRFFGEEWAGIEVLAKPIFVRGVSPFYGSAPRTLQWLAHLAPSSSKIIAPKWGTGVFRNELRKRVQTSLVGGSFCVGNGVGIEALAEPIFVRGVSPFYGSGLAVPFNGSGATASISVSGWRALFFCGSGVAAWRTLRLMAAAG